MKNKNFITISAVLLAIAAIAAGIVVYFGIGGDTVHKGTALVADAWRNLFGSASYDIAIDENASDTAEFLATSTFSGNSTTFEAPQENFPALPTKKISTSKKKAVSNTSDSVQVVPISSNSGTAPESTAATSSLCSFPSSVGSLSRKIILNEIAWMGSPPANGESASGAANDEWMELKNISGASIQLAGWTLLDSSGGIKINFGDDDIVSGGFFLLTRGSALGKTYSGTLPNAGDKLVLIDPQCAVSDLLDASSGWLGGDNTTKQTLERNLDGGGWHTSALPGGTPGAENSLGILSQQPIATSSATSSNQAGGGGAVSDNHTATTTENSSDASSTEEATSTQQTTACTVNHVVIEGIQIAGTASSNDFVKLYNPTSAGIDMSGWKLRKKSQTGTDNSLKALGVGSLIASGSYYIWANSANGFAQSISADTSSTETLAANNSVALISASGTIIDEVAWGTGTNQYVEGSAFPTNPAANQVLQRAAADGISIDTDDNASDFALH